MALTTLKGSNGRTNVILDAGTGGPYQPFFYPKDISSVMSQNGAAGFQIVRAIVIRVDGAQEECQVLIAVRENPYGSSVFDNKSQRIIDENKNGIASGLVGLPCPPFNDSSPDGEPSDPPAK